MEKISSIAKHEVVKLLSTTGQMVERKVNMFNTKGIDDSILVSFITEEEQQTLKEILLKLNREWANAHAKNHSKQHNS